MARIFITGANGFLGQHTTRYFIQKGDVVRGVDRRASGLSLLQTRQRARIDCGRVSKAWLTAHLRFCPDLIMHCAGSGSVGYSQDHPRSSWEMTVKTTLDLCCFMRDHCPEAVLVYPSSAAVYGLGRKGNRCIQEDTPRRPVSLYGAHKVMAEDVIMEYARRFGIKAVIIRFFSLYGPGLRKQILWDVCRRSDNAIEKLVFWGTGRETRDFLFVDDAVRLMDICVKKARGPLTIVNGGTGLSTETRTIVRKTLAVKSPGQRFRFNNIPLKGYPRHLVADVSKSRRIGFKPSVSLDDGLRAYISWYAQGKR